MIPAAAMAALGGEGAAAGALGSVMGGMGGSVPKFGIGELMEFGKSVKQFVMNPLAGTAGVIHTFHQKLTALEAPFKALEGVFQHAGQYVGKFSPWKVEQMTRALDDFQASIGLYLIPVVDYGTKVFRLFADVIAGVYPVLAPFIKGFKELADEGLTATKDVVFTLADAFGQLIEPFQVLIPLVKQGAAGMAFFARGVKVLAGMFGIDGSKMQDSGLGMSYQQAGTTSAESMIGKIKEEAFGYGAGPAEVTAESTKGLFDSFTGGGFVASRAEAIARIPAGSLSMVGSSLGDATREIRDPLTLLGAVLGR